MFYNIQLNVPPIGAAEALKTIFPNRIHEIDAINFLNFKKFVKQTRRLNCFSEWIDDHSTNFPIKPNHRSDGVKTIKRRTLFQSGSFIGLIRIYTFQPMSDNHYILGMDFNVQLPEGVIQFASPDSSFQLNLKTGLWNVGQVAYGKALIRSNDVPLGVDASELVTAPLRRYDYTHQLITSLLPEAAFNTPYIEEDVTLIAQEHCQRVGIFSKDDVDFLENEVKFLLGGNYSELSF